MKVSRQDYWSGLPFPPPRDCPHPVIEPESPALAGGFFTTEPHGLIIGILENERGMQKSQCYRDDA